MSGLGERFPDVQTGEVQATPNEIDRYELYTIIGPMMGTFSWGTGVGTSTQSPTIVFNQAMADYPRNVEVKIVPASGSITGGTVTITGKSQFGVTQTETFAIGTAVNGGTAVGTKVWATFSTAVGTLGTSDAGNGTITIYPASTGTTALFGLPTKVAGSADVKLMTFGSTGVAKPVNGGTIGAFVDTTVHAIKAPNTITTPAGNPTWIQVWYKPTYKNTQKTNLTGL